MKKIISVFILFVVLILLIANYPDFFDVLNETFTWLGEGFFVGKNL